MTLSENELPPHDTTDPAVNAVSPSNPDDEDFDGDDIPEDDEEDEDATDSEPAEDDADGTLSAVPAGTAESPLRRCGCIGVLPGRACTLCNNTRWLRRCERCHGSGLIFQNSRSRYEPRSERCGFCVGRGWIPARMHEVAAILDAHPETATAAAKSAPVPPPQLRPRGPKLPGQPNRSRRRRAT